MSGQHTFEVRKSDGRWLVTHSFDAGNYGWNQPLGRYRWLWVAHLRLWLAMTFTPEPRHD